MKSNVAPSSVNISLPPALRKQLTDKVARLGSYGSTSEYVRELIRRDLQRDAIARVDEKILDGMRSGTTVPVTDAWWSDRRRALKRRS